MFYFAIMLSVGLISIIGVQIMITIELSLTNSSPAKQSKGRHVHPQTFFHQ